MSCIRKAVATKAPRNSEGGPPNAEASADDDVSAKILSDAEAYADDDGDHTDNDFNGAVVVEAVLALDVCGLVDVCVDVDVAVSVTVGLRVDTAAKAYDETVNDDCCVHVFQTNRPCSFACSCMRPQSCSCA